MLDAPTRRRSALAALISASALIIGTVAPAQMASADTGSPAISTAVTITPTTSSQGFIHPGIGVAASALANARAQLLAGADPWKSYFAAMVATPYASRTLTSSNQGQADGVPLNNAFNNVDVENKLGNDASGAYTQAVLYYLTGDPVYRQNALKIVRVWSHMDPTKYAFFADAQIKSGANLYRMIATAELLRYTSVVPSADAYPLAWTTQDTADFTNNFIVPATQTFAYSNAWYMGQGTIPLMGAMAGYIFTDNRARYDEGVEWFTVNASAPDPDINGALSSMYRLIDKSDPRNPYGYSFVNHLEMGRDQAHAGDDVLVLTTLARIVSTQNTRLDPKAGTVSTKKNAVDPYKFLGDRLLLGANAYVGFMMGHDVPWIDVTGQGGQLAQSYRGRWSDSLNELYHIYTYNEGVDVAKKAPYIAQQFQQRDGALFYNFDSLEIGSQIGSDGLRSFWGGSLTGDDYWLSIPAAAKGEASPAADKRLQFDQKASVITGTGSALTEGDRTFLRTNVKTAGTTVAVRSLLYGARSGYSPVAIQVRTNEVSRLDVRRVPDAAPYQSLTVPNTHGQWRYITYDMDTHVVPTSLMGDNNIVYYTFTGKKSQLDLDYVVADAASTVTPPIFPQGTSATVIGIQNVALTAQFTATDSDAEANLAYSASVAPKRASLDSVDGTLTWTPTAKQVGDSTVIVQADDEVATTGLNVNVRVAKDRAGAVQLAQAGYDSSQAYTSPTKKAYGTALAKANALVNSGSNAAFAAAIVALQKAVGGLTLLSPRLVDGTLNYPRITTSTLDSGVVGNLVDNDNSTFAGDLYVNSFTFDFGGGYRVKSSAFDLQARRTFGNRSQGTNVYGSNDNVNWTKLTTKMTTNTNNLETLPVDPSLTNTAFRFLKVQVDQPGAPSDPNFPGIFSVAEFHIHGDRVEAVDRVASAKISANDSVPGIATNGDTVTVAFTTTEAVSNVHGTIEGTDATISGTATNWTASAALPASIASGRNATFSIGYTTADGQTADPLVVTSDGSKLFLSNNTGLIGNVTGISNPVSAAGELEASKQPYVANMFDNNASTFSDVGPVNGRYYITLDFGAGGSVALDHAELLVRQDNWGLSRAGNLHIEGSNDLTTWTTVTNNAKSTLDWQTLALRPGTTTTAYRYLTIANTDWINIAELRLFGVYIAPPPSSVASAHIGSDGPVASRAVGGNIVTLDFATSEAITAVSATINGSAATVTGGGATWHASYQVPSDVSPGRNVGFTVQYAGPNGETRQPLTGTTDGSSVFVSSDTGLIHNVPTVSTPVSLSGQPETNKQVYINRMFDADASTFSDIGPVGGAYYSVLDFGVAHTVSIDHVELLVRQDGFGTGRSGNLHLEGSNDLNTWTPITGNAAATLAWQTMPTPSGTATHTGFRYLKIANTDWINVAELRLFGSLS
ncbi:discoidin domain-containing protein [Leifsonia aquatica]|uniref:discoidin domain-containing protein n=1 Tax=Leifsonia aquatica TaxID=144185 RepID=UPI00046A2724|nr:discoidin domain-containing protein [Leifsonia aquatica]